MRHFRIPAAILLLAVCGVGLASSSGRPVQQASVARASNSFGIELFRRVAAASDEPNQLLSPLGASMALAMPLNGAGGETLAAMRNTLGLGESELAEINRSYESLIEQLRAADPKVEFRLANSVWHERSFPVQPAFQDALRRSFDARVTALDFRDAGAPSAINAWAAEATGDRIQSVVDRIDRLEKLLVLNAVYFKAPWAVTFSPGLTRPDTFTMADGRLLMVPFMRKDSGYLHFEGDGVQVVELYCGSGAYRMTLVKPTEGSLDDLQRRLTVDTWENWIGRLERGRILLLMPKFRFEFGAELNDALAAMGMAQAFAPDTADFSGINPDRKDLHISRVQQQTFIDVHELGVEAAGVTRVTMSILTSPPVLEFDRPFLFAIRESGTGALLFLGRLGDPSA